jgi:adenylate cyclase
MFSAPVHQADHQSRALACAVEMQRFASGYSNDLKAKGVAFGPARVGVHTGEVIVGNFGGSMIFDYRALGDPVNTASRLEAVNKHLGTRTCVSEATLAGCTNARVRPIGRLVLKGKSVPIRVFQPLDDGLDTGTADTSDAEYEAAYALMAEGSAGARAAFSALAESRPNDLLAKFHLMRVQEGQTGDLIVMTEK